MVFQRVRPCFGVHSIDGLCTSETFQESLSIDLHVSSPKNSEKGGPLSTTLLAHHQNCKRTRQRRAESNSTRDWCRRVGRNRPVLECHAEHVIRLCVECDVPGAQHRWQPLLYFK